MAPKPDPTDDPAKGKPDTKTDDADLGDGGKKALDAERKARREAEQKNKDLEARLAKLEDPNAKSEADQLKEQMAKLQEDLEEERILRLRTEVAAEKGLTAAQAKRLTGSTKEELEEDADDLLEAFPAPEKGDEDDSDGKPAAPRRPPTQRPTERLKPGTGTDEAPVEETDIKKLGARMFEG
jgi:hypothetical protein